MARGVRQRKRSASSRAGSAERRLPTPAFTLAYTLGGPKCHVYQSPERILLVSRGKPGWAVVSAAYGKRRCLVGMLLLRQYPPGVGLYY